MKKIKKIHFVGIKGVGVAPLAIIAKEAGCIVTGSDVSDIFITDNALEGIKIFSGFSEDNVGEVDLVVTTGAHGGLGNPECVFAKAKGIPVMSQGEALGKFINGDILGKKFDGIAVCGSHGKTTLSAIIATMLSENSMDPSYAIGTGSIKSLGKPGHFGKGQYFVAEADEYVVDIVYDKTPKLLLLDPKIIVTTNIDYDHPDIYPTMEDMLSTFVKFTKRLPPDGILIACGDSEEDKRLLNLFENRKISFGFSKFNDLHIKKVSMNDERVFFWPEYKGTIMGEFSMRVFGEQNAVNALGAIAVGLEIGMSLDQIKKGLKSYAGSKRRSEFIGKTLNGALIYDDYAHHPEEIKQTLVAFKKAFPRKRIVCVFQPHMYSRTKKLLEQFINSFKEADELVVSEIFPSFREEIDENFSAKLISDGVGNKSVFLKNTDDVVEYLNKKEYTDNTLILTMGAGDIYKVGEKIKYD